jgi:hypothetical protein
VTSRGSGSAGNGKRKTEVWTWDLRMDFTVGCLVEEVAEDDDDAGIAREWYEFF